MCVAFCLRLNVWCPNPSISIRWSCTVFGAVFVTPKQPETNIVPLHWPFLHQGSMHQPVGRI